MVAFVVTLEGTNIAIESDGEPITGFYAARLVMATSEDCAVEEAMRIIGDEWEITGHKDANSSATLRLKLDSIRRLNLIDRLFSKTPSQGFTFY